MTVKKRLQNFVREKQSEHIMKKAGHTLQHAMLKENLTDEGTKRVWELFNAVEKYAKLKDVNVAKPILKELNYFVYGRKIIDTTNFPKEIKEKLNEFKSLRRGSLMPAYTGGLVGTVSALYYFIFIVTPKADISERINALDHYMALGAVIGAGTGYILAKGSAERSLLNELGNILAKSDNSVITALRKRFSLFMVSNKGELSVTNYKPIIGNRGKL